MFRTDSLSRALLFRVLSNEVRIKLVESLAEGEKNVSDLCSAIGQEQTRVSHELRCLLVCGLVEYRREGRQIIYSLNSDTVLPILKAADKHAIEFSERIKGCEIVSEMRRVRLHELKV